MINVLNKTLEEVRPVVKNSINEVTVCKDIYNNEMFVLIKLTDRKATKQILGLLYAPDGQSLLPKEMFVGNEVFNGQMMLLFNYLPERRLLSYIKAESESAANTIETIKDLIISYFAFKTAPSLKKLIINEGNVNIKPSGRVYFGTLLDFELLDQNCGEKDCVEQIINMINKILLEFDVTEDKEYKNVKSIKLFFKKFKNNTHSSLVEVYNDFKLDDGLRFKTRFDKIKSFFSGGGLVRIGKTILIVTVVCAICAAANWLLNKSTLVVGFRNSNLDLIGTVDMTRG